jgi:hypothetical protein
MSAMNLKLHQGIVLRSLYLDFASARSPAASLLAKLK